MKTDFGLALTPSTSIRELVELSKSAEEKGFSSVWLADEIPWKDPWIILATIAMNTKRVKLGPGVTNPFLRNPVCTAQAVGTLNELSDGRAFCGIAMGAPTMLKQCNIQPKKPFIAVKEATVVIRKMLSGESVSFDGEHFKYSNVQTCAKSTENIPIYIGGETGPLSFRIAGEVADGVCVAHAVTRDRINYVIENVSIGLEIAERTSKEFRIIDVILFSINEDEKLARDTIKPLVTYYLPWLTDRQLEKYNIDKDESRKVSNLIRSGNLRKAIELTSDETVDSLSISGTPEEVKTRFEELISQGVDEIVLSMVDNDFLRNIAGIEVEGSLDFRQTIDLCSETLLKFFG